MAMTSNYSNEELVEGIRCNNKTIISYIYINYYPLIEKIILNQFKGSIEQSKDVFQDALLVIYTASCGNPPLKIQKAFSTFLTTICKRKLIDEFRGTKKEVLGYNVDDFEDEEPSIIDMLNKEDRIRLYEKHFNLLGEKCKELLTLFLEGHSISAITRMLKMSTEQFTKNRKLQCKISLFKRIYEDPTLKELINGKPWNIREIPRW